jgi:PPOX class probable F420-dependent enzyme
VDDATRAFLVERHLGALTIVRPDGRPHVTAVGFTYEATGDGGLVRVITWSGSVKSRLLERNGTLWAAVCQVDGARWLSLAGPAVVSADPARCADAVQRYAQRYSPPKDRGADRRVIELRVAEVRGRA